MTVQPSERAAGSEDDLGGEWAASHLLLSLHLPLVHSHSK